MNRFVLVFVAVVVAVAMAAPDGYTTKYDNVNLEEILSNDRLRNKYVECLTSTSDEHCTPEGKELKSVVSDALTTDCAKCNEKQKNGTKYVVDTLLDKYPDDYAKLEKVYDADGAYRKKYEVLKAEGKL
uniref:Chemosensory protein n=1 Tax=Gryllotalpa orientalis TaxID=213494 RepID=Q6VYH6_GRYOR|nr:chemosensory protein [Gryllotalpa orientalis]